MNSLDLSSYFDYTPAGNITTFPENMINWWNIILNFRTWTTKQEYDMDITLRTV